MMNPKTTVVKTPYLLGVGLLAIALLGACANPLEALKEKVATEVGEKVISEAVGADIDLGGTELPSDLPTEVPLPEGELRFSMTHTQDTQLWTLQYEVADGDTAMENYRQVALDQGFEEDTWGDMGGLKVGGFSNENYNLILGLVPQAGTDTSDIMQLVVGEE